MLRFKKQKIIEREREDGTAKSIKIPKSQIPLLNAIAFALHKDTLHAQVTTPGPAHHSLTHRHPHDAAAVGSVYVPRHCSF